MFFRQKEKPRICLNVVEKKVDDKTEMPRRDDLADGDVSNDDVYVCTYI